MGLLHLPRRGRTDGQRRGEGAAGERAVAADHAAQPQRDEVSGLASAVRRFCRICESVFWRLEALRVDLREGFPTESSSAYCAFLPARIDSARPPALRPVALTPGSEVSTGFARLGVRGSLGFFGPDRSSSYRNLSAFVAMQPPCERR